MADSRTDTVQALGIDRYGPIDALRPIAIPRPVPGPGDLRVRVVASALNPADYKVVDGTMWYLHARRFPLVIGYDLSGVVDAVGPGVDGFAVGDEVFGFLPYGPSNARGALAEVVVTRARHVARKPANVPHLVAAAAATPAVTALLALRIVGRLPERDGKVLITGVSGGVGSLAVSVAARLQAHVVATGSGDGLGLALRLGADSVRDRRQGDIRRPNDRFDVVLDAAAAYAWRHFRRSLAPTGGYVTTLPSLRFARDKVSTLFSRSRAHWVRVEPRAAYLEQVASWLADGLPVTIGDTVTVRDVPDALGRLARGAVLGRVAVHVDNAF